MRAAQQLQLMFLASGKVLRTGQPFWSGSAKPSFIPAPVSGNSRIGGSAWPMSLAPGEDAQPGDLFFE